jgi:hypothetical protein
VFDENFSTKLNSNEIGSWLLKTKSAKKLPEPRMLNITENTFLTLTPHRLFPENPAISDKQSQWFYQDTAKMTQTVKEVSIQLQWRITAGLPIQNMELPTQEVSNQK